MRTVFHGKFKPRGSGIISFAVSGSALPAACRYLSMTSPGRRRNVEWHVREGLFVGKRMETLSIVASYLGITCLWARFSKRIPGREILFWIWEEKKSQVLFPIVKWTCRRGAICGVWCPGLGGCLSFVLYTLPRLFLVPSIFSGFCAAKAWWQFWVSQLLTWRNSLLIY